MSKRRKRNKRKTGNSQWSQPNYIKTNKHHRLAKSLGGTFSDENISVVPICLHEAYNALFGGNATPQQVCKVLTTVWIDPAYVIVCIPKCECGLLFITGDGTYKSP